ncbi:1-acyl-sn-glycerol-3-phosphate acyltransferase [Bacteriovorax sp. DB6_IX]|uniref:lysophospholipid acyltransferase family protein n=1 Tax=Bacteriovorax sp. DB6_IX TaxID=1353530 RepID=UPI000389E45D|nr:1-acylglycerol-3-phosphate O-acyltransferase [Bacteriovorax sp. DB6_IX]EQC49682.1 putative 1-acyl-sn-glycerol-3-phosphate acyltransferase [Bacteriovorax sp. DB6_IX]
MFGTILKYTRFVLLAISIALISFLCSIIFLFRPANMGNTYLAARMIGNVGAWLMGMKVEVEGLENFKQDENFVVISNHQSNFDIFYVGKMVPRRTVSVGKKSILYFPFFGQMYWLSGNILINRGNRRKAWNVMDKVAQAITSGRGNVWIMPEGTRSKGRGTLPFKKGAFVTAIKAQSKIIPVCISSFDKHVDISKWHSGTIKMKVLSPIDAKGKTMDELNELKNEAYEIVSKTVAELDNSYI